MSEPRTVAITGANGYVGTTLARAFDAAGWRVVALQRTAPQQPGYDYLHYTLEDGPAQPLPESVDTVVHCAYDLRARKADEVTRVNVAGTERLLAAIAPDTDIVLISSMSAYAGTTQLYGRTKVACEQLVTARGGTSLRLGLVYGADGGGMIGALSKVAALPVVPVLRPDSHQFTVHADDMARCVLAAATDRPEPHHVLGVANPRATAFTEVIRQLHDAASKRRFRTIGIRSAWLYRGLRAIEASGLRIGFRADSLLGLIRPAPDVPHADYWAEQGITLRPFDVAGRAR